MEIAPASKAIIYKGHRVSLEDRIQEHGIYSGKSSPALDQAWHDLLNCRCNGCSTDFLMAGYHLDDNIRLEPEIMCHYGRTDIGVALADSNEDVVGTINISYHELHCINCMG